MKIEKLNENKIKITLNIDDLADKNIDLYSFMHNTPETQSLFWDILSEAEKTCGFNVDNSMIYVEATTSGAGNFSLIVTKTNEKPLSLSRPINNTLKKKNFKLKRKVVSLNLEKNIYLFQSFDDICEFVKIIDLKKIDRNSLYSFNNKYYLKISNMPFNNILEYATVSQNFETLDAKLNEYGTLLIKDNALQTIHKYFNKKTKK